VQSLLEVTSVQALVQTPYCPLGIWQLKQVVPVAQGPPQAGTNVVQTPAGTSRHRHPVLDL
jgi:hypothetical protein